MHKNSPASAHRSARISYLLFVPAWLLCLNLSMVFAQEGEKDIDRSFGHSAHGALLDEGPRQRPWKMEGIGSTHFQVTSSVPEVQEWFDQGHTLMHSFWHFEAERAFRWCIKLDPNCATAWWGLSRTLSRYPKRFRAALKEAVRLKAGVSKKEQRYIDAWAKAFLADLENIKDPSIGWNGTNRVLAEELEKIIIDYPDDIEAKALYVLSSIFGSGKYAREAVLQEVLKRNSEHPGAIHYRIHNWDTLKLGNFALDSCEAYGKVAPQVGHANHMPGHIYNKVGMWHEGAINLEAATRVEKDYMVKRLIQPYFAWNYSHNRNFLAHAQAMLGLPSLALQGARDLLNAPLDPDVNSAEPGYSTFRQGLSALRRTLVRFERWDEILKSDSIPFGKNIVDEAWSHYCKALAHLGKGELESAETELLELRRMKSKIDGARKKFKGRKGHEHRDLAKIFPFMWREVQGKLLLRQSKIVLGLKHLTEAAELEFENRKHNNDPPSYPRCLYNVLGEAYLALQSPKLAVGAFLRGFKVVRNSGNGWAGLTEAYLALGNLSEAQAAYSAMLAVWSDAEPGIAVRERAVALAARHGLSNEAKDPSPRIQRNYLQLAQKRTEPATWNPVAAPSLSVASPHGQEITLEAFKGKNVLLIFYLSEQCVHCVEQLQAVAKKSAELAKRDTVVLAVSSDPPEKNRSGDLNALPFQVLSDSKDHSNALRFLSYDEFEDLELHSTHVIDRQGRLRWSRIGGDPFMNIDFILSEIDRVEKMSFTTQSSPAPDPQGSDVRPASTTSQKALPAGSAGNR